MKITFKNHHKTTLKACSHNTWTCACHL